MADDNKALKYTRYAIGEIVLVVIGILIALQINNWNENKKNDRWETRFLTDLKSELNNDYNQLQYVHNFQMKKGNSCQNVLDLITTLIEGEKWKIDSVYTISQFGNPTFFPTTGVYDSGLSAGKIENIKNDSLKYAIMNLYNHYYKRLVYNGEVLDDVVEKVDWEKRIYFDESTGVIKSWSSIHEFEFKAQIRFLLDQNLVYTRLTNENLEEIKQVINLIKNELNP